MKCIGLQMYFCNKKKFLNSFPGCCQAMQGLHGARSRQHQLHRDRPCCKWRLKYIETTFESKVRIVKILWSTRQQRKFLSQQNFTEKSLFSTSNIKSQPRTNRILIVRLTKVRRHFIGYFTLLLIFANNGKNLVYCKSLRQGLLTAVKASRMLPNLFNSGIVFCWIFRSHLNWKIQPDLGAKRHLTLAVNPEDKSKIKSWRLQMWVRILSRLHEVKLQK